MFKILRAIYKLGGGGVWQDGGINWLTWWWLVEGLYGI